MAAVAAEPAAAAVLITTITAATDEEGSVEPGPVGPGLTGDPLETDGLRETGPVVQLVRVEDDGVEEHRHVRPEMQSSETGGNDEHTGSPTVDRFSTGIPGDPEVYRSILQPSAVFLHSFPDPPPVTEAGLSLAEPSEPSTNVTTDRDYRALVQPEDAMLDPETDPGTNSAGLMTDTVKQEKPTEEDFSRPGPGPDPGHQDLTPGSEVRVSLDHVIDDALVVSFRLGEKVFSGVLMDVSKR